MFVRILVFKQYNIPRQDKIVDEITFYYILVYIQ